MSKLNEIVTKIINEGYKDNFDKSDYSYITTGHRLPGLDLHTHEYYGKDFENGKMSVAIFETAKNTFIAVWSWGANAWKDVKKDKRYIFRHTQTSATVELTYTGYAFNSDNYAAKAPVLRVNFKKAMPQWTLK